MTHDTNYRVLVVDAKGDTTEVLATANHFGIAYAAYKATLQARTWSTIQLREKGRIVRTAKTGGYDSAKQEVELEWER